MIQVSGLKKSFNKKPALKGIDFKVSRGEIFGLLEEKPPLTESISNNRAAQRYEK